MINYSKTKTTELLNGNELEAETMNSSRRVVFCVFVGVGAFQPFQQNIFIKVKMGLGQSMYTYFLLCCRFHVVVAGAAT